MGGGINKAKTTAWNFKKHILKNKGKIGKHLAGKAVSYLTGDKMSHNKHIAKIQHHAKQAKAAYETGKEVYEKGKNMEIPKSKEEFKRLVHGQAKALFKNKDVVRHTTQYIKNHTEKGLVPKHDFKRMFKKGMTDVQEGARKRVSDTITQARSDINKRYRKNLTN